MSANDAKANGPLMAVAREILEIMDTYREQEKSSYGVGTPGGLEHMGDVWRLLSRWDAQLRPALAAAEADEARAVQP